MAAHLSSVPAPKVQHMARHRRGHQGWCQGTLLLDFCILDISISGERAGREPRVAATGMLMGHGGNMQPRGHHGRSWRRGWCHLGSAGKSPPAISQDKPALLVASKTPPWFLLGAEETHAEETMPGSGCLLTQLENWCPTQAEVGSQSPPPELPLHRRHHWEISWPRWQSTGEKLLQTNWVDADRDFKAFFFFL